MPKKKPTLAPSASSPELDEARKRYEKLEDELAVAKGVASDLYDRVCILDRLKDDANAHIEALVAETVVLRRELSKMQDAMMN